jgi:hypothetical protein
MFITQYNCLVIRFLNFLHKGLSHFDHVHVGDLSEPLYTYAPKTKRLTEGWLACRCVHVHVNVPVSDLREHMFTWLAGVQIYLPVT